MTHHVPLFSAGVHAVQERPRASAPGSVRVEVRGGSRAGSPGEARAEGARRALYDEILRVDHAGEYGAVRIYEGQLAVLGRTHPSETPTLRHMRAQESVHLEDMSRLLTERRARPTALLPLWDVLGFALGAGTALLGKEAAHACTVAVEEAISAHYDAQIRDMLERGLGHDKEVLELLKKNRDEELQHLTTAKERGAERAPGYEALRAAIRTGCNVAIWVTKRV